MDWIITFLRVVPVADIYPICPETMHNCILINGNPTKIYFHLGARLEAFPLAYCFLLKPVNSSGSAVVNIWSTHTNARCANIFYRTNVKLKNRLLSVSLSVVHVVIVVIQVILFENREGTTLYIHKHK